MQLESLGVTCARDAMRACRWWTTIVLSFMRIWNVSNDDQIVPEYGVGYKKSEKKNEFSMVK